MTQLVSWFPRQLALAAGTAAILVGTATTPVAGAGHHNPPHGFPLRAMTVRYVTSWASGRHARSRPYSAWDRAVATKFLQTLAEAAEGSGLGLVVLRAEDGASHRAGWYLDQQRAWLAFHHFRLVRLTATVLAVGPSVPGASPRSTHVPWSLMARIFYTFSGPHHTFTVGLNYWPTKPGWIADYTFWISKRGYPRLLQSVYLEPALTDTGGTPISEPVGVFSLTAYEVPAPPGPPPVPPFNSHGYVPANATG